MVLKRQQSKYDAEVESLSARFKSECFRIREYSTHSSTKVHSVGWNSDGSRLAAGGVDKSVCVAGLTGGDKLSKEQTLRGHSDCVDQLVWHPGDPDVLATASCDRSVRIWDVRSGKAVATVSTKGENINVAWCPDGKVIAVGNKEDLVTFIDVRMAPAAAAVGGSSSSSSSSSTAGTTTTAATTTGVGGQFRVLKEEQFKFEVNEIAWNKTSDLFFLTNGLGCVHIHSYPDMELVHVLQAHPANCICIEFDPTGRYFGVGSADALVSLWDVKELACLRTFSRLDWPVRAISFSHDGKLLASASEDLFIDISHVESGRHVADVTCSSPTFTVAWHPNRYLLAYACDEKDKYERDRNVSLLKVFGFPNDDQQSSK